MASKRKKRLYTYRRSKIIRLRSGAAYKKYLKDLGLLRCEFCGWHDHLSEPYYLLETHHMIRCADGGKNCSSNYVALCPNHHALADRLSKKNPGMITGKKIMLALIGEHEHNRLNRKV